LLIYPNQFPTSIAASSTLLTVCVAHTGALAGISCAKFDPLTGISPFDALRPFALQQSNPPTGPLNGIGSTFFTPDSTALITTVKGNPKAPVPGSLPGFISMFPVIDAVAGAVGTTNNQNTPPGTAVLFGTVPIPGTTKILATDASFGALILDLSDPTMTPLSTTPLPKQKATCWSTISQSTGTGFVTDVGVNRLVEMDLETGAVVGEVNSRNGNPGMLDLQASGVMLYAMAPGNGSTAASVAVFDVSGGRGTGREVQNFGVQGMDNRAMGMAFFA